MASPAKNRPLRKDASRNRESLLAAARDVFAERGLDAPLDEIARRAGVSIGTLYNRFPSRGVLIDAVFADRVEAVEHIAEQALALPDPWSGLVYFLERTCEMQAADLGYNDLACQRVLPATVTEDSKARGYELMQRIILRAQESGALRPDVTLADMAFVVWGHARTVAATARIAPDVWRRHLGLLLDGLRASAAHPLPVPPLSPEQVASALGGACDG
jgi:AcrR family transcriptional regulator